ncbi:MAG: AraC family transcriptional regulator [Gaiellaceae bacterium]
MPVGTRFEWHAHGDHQLAWSPEGVLVVLTEGGGSYVLPPSRALWIPAGTVHETRASGAAVLRSVYLPPRRSPVDWTTPTPVEVSPLLGELIHHLDDRGLGAKERSRAEAVLFDLLLPLRIPTIAVRPPTDPRARDVSEALLADPADPRTLHEWGRAVGASSRTLARAFLSDTGLSFGRWRTLVRLQASLRYLAERMPVSAVAPLVGYRTTSAYVAAFRAHTGVTPGRYFQPPVAESLPRRAAGRVPVGLTGTAAPPPDRSGPRASPERASSRARRRRRRRR